MATDYLAELQKDISEKLNRLLPTREADVDKPPRQASRPELPLTARLPPRGHIEDDWRARPTAQRPWPVILIHGTGDTNGIWQQLTIELREDGWAVFVPEFGHRCTDHVEESAAQVGAYIEAVLTVTQAEQVVLVGHSQGGVLARYWMRLLDGASKVHHLISLGVPHHGTTMGGMLSSVTTTKMGETMMNSIVQSWFGPSGFQLITGHPMLEELNAGGSTEDGVGYTNIATKYDTIIQPTETSFLSSEDPEADITNILLQDLDPKCRVLHMDMPGDVRIRELVRETLDGLAA